MKKTIKIASFLIVAMLLVTACGKKEDKAVKYADIMEDYAVPYYEKYQKNIKGMTILEVTIADLKRANEKMGEKYDLTKLAACKETSKARFTVDADNTKILEKEFVMDCEK